jgi:tetratricopeptide (TPR) repeat protein
MLLAGSAAGAQSSSVYRETAGHLQRGDAGSAIQLLEPVLERQPNDLRALTLMGMALTTAGKRQEANGKFKQALNVDPRFAPALRNLAMNEMALGLFPDAKLHFEQLLKLTPTEPVAHLALGELAFRNGAYSQAVEHFEQSQELHLRDPRNLLNYADACLRTNQAAKAGAALARMPETADPALNFEAGALLVKLRDFEAAADRFAKALKAHPDPYLAGYNLALAQLKAGRHAQTALTAEALIASGHRTSELYNVLAHAYENTGRTKEAYEALRTATQINPDDEANYLDLIAICLAHNNLDLALEIAGIGIARLPSSDRLHLQRGVVWAMKGKFEEARFSFEASAALAPKKTLPHVALGLILMQMDKPGDAVQVLRKLSAGPKSDYLVNWFLAEALNRVGVAPDSAEEKEAVNALSKSVRLNPSQVQSRILLAKLLMRRGQLDQAMDHLEHALKLEPDSVPATYQLAQVWQKKGDAGRARELFAKVSKARAEEREQFASRGLQQIVREGAR